MTNISPATTSEDLASAVEFTPLQLRGAHPIFGLSRSTFLNLEKEKLIRIVRLRRPGTIRGRCLIDCASVRKYFSKLATQQAGKHAAAKEGGAA